MNTRPSRDLRTLPAALSALLLGLVSAAGSASAADPAPPAKPTSAASPAATSAHPPAVAPAEAPVPLGACCKAAAKGPLTGRVTVKRDGTPFRAGHAADVYYAGDAPSGTPLPAGYRFTRAPLKVDLALRFPKLKTVTFMAFHAGPGGKTLTPEAEAAMAQLLARHLGADRRISRLGQGGHQVVWKACTPKPARCVVAKLRKIARAVDAKSRAERAGRAAAHLKRDLAMFAVAEAVTLRGTLLDKKGRPLALRIGGKLVAPQAQPAGPPGRIARIARLLRPELLAEGIVVQELVAARASPALKTMLRGLEGPDGALRDTAWTNAPKHGVNRVRVLGFLDRYKSMSRIGPDVIRLAAFVRDCEAVSKVPTIGRFCRLVKRDLRVPDDFLLRVRALEQLYRDSAGQVIRFHRANFGDAVGNPGVDGSVFEVGLDYNHGRNVGWDPATMQFVLFDA